MEGKAQGELAQLQYRYLDCAEEGTNSVSRVAE